MADPVIVICPAGQWTKVADNVTVGLLHRKSAEPGIYLQTYRDAGGAAPTDEEEGVQTFVEGEVAEISATAGIDVYIWPVGGGGSVRVDL